MCINFASMGDIISSVYMMSISRKLQRKYVMVVNGQKHSVGGTCRCRVHQGLLSAKPTGCEVGSAEQLRAPQPSGTTCSHPSVNHTAQLPLCSPGACFCAAV